MWFENEVVKSKTTMRARMPNESYIDAWRPIDT